MTLKELSKAFHEKDTDRYPNVPDHAVPRKKFSEADANELQKSIEAYLKYKGHYARRLSSEGRFRPGEEYENVMGKKTQLKGQWLPGLNVGMPDIFGILSPHGKFLGIEVKFGADRQSKDQKTFEEKTTKAGAIYMIVRAWDDFINQISKYIK